MSYSENPSFFEEEIEKLIEEQETNKTDAEERNPTLDRETFKLNTGYDFYLERSQSLLIGMI
jgi:hypothetical protein